jgi:hypothetical protein
MLLISACSSRFQKNIPDDFSVVKNPEYGVVVGSVSSIPDDRWQEMSQYRYQSLSDKKIQGVFTSAAKYNPYTFFAHVPKCEDDGMEAECGRLFATALAAGDYEIYGVVVSLDEPKNRWEGRILSGYGFTVVRGQVSYIGNLKSYIQVGPVSYSSRDIVSADGMVVDEFERDVPLLKAKFPELANWEIDRSLIRGDSWEWRRSNKGKDDVTFH